MGAATSGKATGSAGPGIIGKDTGVVGTPCAPTTVPPGRAAAMGGSAIGTGGNVGDVGDSARAAGPVSRTALVSHRRNPRMVCLAAVGGRRPSGPVGSLVSFIGRRA